MQDVLATLVMDPDSVSQAWERCSAGFTLNPFVVNVTVCLSLYGDLSQG